MAQAPQAPQGEGDEIVHLTFRVPRRLAEHLKNTATRHGFSLNTYLMHLFHVQQGALRLEGHERLVLQHLARWGRLNFHNGTPSLARFAATAMVTEEGVRAAVLRMVGLELMEEVPGPVISQAFNDDIIIDGHRYKVTDAGRFSAELLA